MNNAARMVKRIVRSGSNILLSLSPMPLPNSIKLSNVDWPKMLEQGFFGEVVPQFYTQSYETFTSKIIENEALISETVRSRMLCGVRVNGSGPLTSWKNVKAMIAFANARKYGVVIWYARGIIIDYAHEFHEIWN